MKKMSFFSAFFLFHYTKTSNLDNFKYVTIFLISLLYQKIQLVKVSQKQPKMVILSLLWKAVTFVPVKISKRWLHIWNCLSLKFLCSEYEIFSFSRKKVHFFHLHFSSSFSLFFTLFNVSFCSTRTYLSNEVSFAI